MSKHLEEKLIGWLPWVLSGSLLAVFLSISISQILLGLALLIWLFLRVRGRVRIEFPAFFWGLLAYSALSLVACVFSKNPAGSFYDARELLLFLVVPLVFSSFRNQKQIIRADTALLVSAMLSILLSMADFLLRAAPGERIAGFMDHYMTQAGLLMLFSALAVSLFLFSRRGTRIIWGGAAILAGAALILTLTRNAWVGLVVIVCLLLALYKPKILFLVPAAVGLFLLLSPGHIKQRALSIFSTRSYSNAIRLEYIGAGLKIIKENPLTGTGPNTVHIVFQNPRYGLSEDARNNVHLHNNPLQIAAERGLPTLLAWLVFMVWAGIGLIRLLKDRNADVFPAAAAGLAALLGLAAAGMFEYNFHDAEVTLLFLYLISMPFVVQRIREKAPQEV